MADQNGQSGELDGSFALARPLAASEAVEQRPQTEEHGSFAMVVPLTVADAVDQLPEMVALDVEHAMDQLPPMVKSNLAREGDEKENGG